MKRKNLIRLAAVGVVASALVAGSAGLANAAIVPTVGSNGDYYLVDSLDGSAVPAGKVMNWTYDASGSPEPENPEGTKMFDGPADAETVRTFISPRGKERVPSEWVAYAESSFNTPDSKRVLLPNAAPSMQILGPMGANGVRAAGGDYSIGVAFLKTNHLYVASDVAYYTYITVTPGTGEWTFDTPSGTEQPEPGSMSGDIDIEATTVAAQEGDLSLSVPAGAKATLGAAALVNNQSTSTGVLPDFSVVDERVSSRPGWTLDSNVVDFTMTADPSKTIAKKQLGYKPTLEAGGTSTGVVLGGTQTAGSASYPAKFAEAPAGSGVGTTVLSGDLTFVAPSEAPAGTYTSKMTLTLVSK